MTYYSGFVLAVPNANKQAYFDHAKACWPMFQKRGAIRMVENWGEDVPDGKLTDFKRATQAKPDETVMFSWIEWPDRETCDKAWANMMEDMEGQPMPEMPFDGMRMFWGGFAPLYDSDRD